MGETEFEYTVNRIVFSVPGYHKGDEMNKVSSSHRIINYLSNYQVGHMLVRSILKKERASDQVIIECN